MESQLNDVKEACKDLLGEEALGAKIAANVRDLFINDSIQRIQEATTTTAPVWKELEVNGSNNERVCESALEKIWAITQQYYRDADGNSRHGFEIMPLVREHVLPGGSIETILACVTSYEENESIQETGVTLLGVFASCVEGEEQEANVAVLTSARCATALCSAMTKFPDSTQVHEAVLSVIPVIDQASVGFSGPDGSNFYSNLIAADALSLSFRALERHTDNYDVVYGALFLFGKVGTCALGRRMEGNNSDGDAYLDFIRAHPNYHEVVANARETQQRLHPDDIFIDREAFITSMSVGFMGMGFM